MADIRDKHNKHLFLEDKPVAHESFIANVNKAVEHLDDIANFNNIMAQDGVVDFVSTVLETIDETTNEWIVTIEETTEKLLTASSAFNYSIVVDIANDTEAGATITLPNILRYTVGSGMLMLTYNGAVCYIDEQYTEVGLKGETSKYITINFPMRCGDKLGVRVIALSEQELLDSIVNVINNILSTDIPVTTTGTEVPRYLTDRFADVINVKDFGAIGDGVTNDTQAFEKATQFGWSLDHEFVLYIPVGVFPVDVLPTVPCYGSGNVLYKGYNFSPFELLMKIRGGIIKDPMGRYKLDFACLTDTDRIQLLRQIVKYNDDGTYHSVFIDDEGKFYIDFYSIPLDVLGDLVKGILTPGGGLEVDEDGNLVINIDVLSDEEIINIVKRIIKDGGGLVFDEDGLIYVDFDSMEPDDLLVLIKQIIKEGGGLDVDENGNIYVRFETMSEEELMALIKQIIGESGGLTTDEEGKLVLNLIEGKGIILEAEEDGTTISIALQEGGGLAFDSEDQVYVDFSLMPTDKFEVLIQSLNLPFFLTSSRDFYVNGTTGSDDTTIENIGQSEDNPFKTISACTTYVVNNFNLASGNVNIYIAPGTYTESVTCPGYSRTTGNIRFFPLNPSNRPTIQATNQYIFSVTQGTYYFYGLNLIHHANSPSSVSRTGCIHVDSYGTGIVCGCRFTINNYDYGNSSSSYGLAIGSQGLGGITPDTSGNYGQTTFTSNFGYSATGNTSFCNLLYSAGRMMLYSASGVSESNRIIPVTGAASTAIALDGGQIQVREDYTGTIYFQDNGLQGIRFQISGGGSIITRGRGSYYFPGTTAGYIETSTYSFYS